MSRRLERGQVPHLQLVAIRRAHDVRTLRACNGCEQIGHAHSMIDVVGAEKDRHTRWYHGRCFVDAFGAVALARLPRETTDRLTLGDLGTRLMRALVVARERVKARATRSRRLAAR